MSEPVNQVTSIRWRILAILVGASFVAYLLRTNMSIAGDSMVADLGLSRIQLGMVLAAFAWGYAIFQFPGGVLGDRIGGRRALTLIAIGWGVCNLLVALVPGRALASPTLILATLIVLRFLMGAVQAPLYPVTGGGTTCNWFPVAGWALPNALSNAGLAFGSAAAGPLIAWQVGSVGWRQSFAITAPLAFLVAGLWWWYGRNTPAEHPSVGRRELELINAGRPPPERATGAGAWKSVLKDRQVWLLTASYFCSNYLFYFFFNWLFIYLVESRELKLLEGGFFAAAPWMSGAVGAVVGGMACDRLARRRGARWGYRVVPIISLALAAGLLVLAGSAESAYGAVIFLSLCLGFQQMSEGAFWGATIAVSGKHASAACGVLNTGGNVVGGIGALVVPMTVTALGWTPALLTTSVFALVAALLWFLVRADQPMADAF